MTRPKPRKDKPNKKQREVVRLEKQDEAQSKKPKSIEAVSAELLSFRTIREGMIILGCVKSIHPTSIEVALPGRMNGIVNVSSISQKYLELTQQYIQNETVDTKSGIDDEYKPISSLFEIGQVVCVKVMKIDTSKTNKIHIDLSMLPKDIQADFKHQSVSASMIMFVAIAERQEHGYVIETGVNNLRGFLRDTNNNLIVGGVYLCRVIKALNSKSASTATFELANDTKNRIAQFTEPNVSHILPGILVNFKVTRILKDGLQGTLYNGSLVAYINEHQLGFSDKQNPKEPKNFDVNSKIVARVLYIMPLTKIAYLSLNLQSQFKINSDLPVGTIVEKAVVSHTGTGGIILKLPNAKGVISLRSLKSGIKANFDMDTLLNKYQPNTIHKIRVLHYDPIDFLHVCSVDPKIINEKYYSSSDIKTGDFVNATIQRKLNDGRYAITVGQIKGYIHPTHLAKTTSADKLHSNQKLKCRVLCKNQAKEEIFLTNLKEYLDEKAPILTANQNLSRDTVFLGLVKRCISDGWLIEFFDYLTGMIYRNQLAANELSLAEKFYVGQIVKVTIKYVRTDADKKHITLGLADYLTDIGRVYAGKISAVQPTGLEVAFLQDNLNGFVPIMYLSDFPSLVHGLHRTHQCNDDITAIGVAQNCYSVRDVTDVSGKSMDVKKFTQIKVGDIVPAIIKNVSNDLIDVHPLIKDFRTTISIHLNMFIENYEKVGDVTLLPDQKVFVRILAKNNTLKTLTCSARLDDVWPGHFEQTVQMVRRYFSNIREIETRIKSKNTIKLYRVGQIVEGVLIESDRVDKNNQPIRTFLLDGGVKLYVTQSNDATRKKEKDKKHKILVIWIDYANEVLYGTMQPKYLERAGIKQNEEDAVQQLLTHRGFKANVLLTLEDIIIVYPIKWTNRFVYIPTRVHYNDFQPLIVKCTTEGCQINVSVIDVEGDHFIGMHHGLFELYSKKIDQTIKLEVKEDIITMKSKKRKAVSSKPDEDQTLNKKKKLKQKKTHEISGKKTTKFAKRFSMKLSQVDGAMDLAYSSSDEEENQLPGVSNFWSTDLNVLNAGNAQTTTSESSSEDESTSPKKRKLTSKQRFEAARSEESRIREIEKCLADDTILPTSIDQFDRLVMAQPNNSRAWINYMVFHVIATDIDKARTIAKKALQTIDAREEQERLNIWVALLNMEIRFGSKDAFDEVFKEALLVNEPFKVYSVCLKIFVDCKRIEELCDMTLTITKKFRQNFNAWIIAAQALFEVDLGEKSKTMLNRALNSLPERDRKYSS